MCSGSRECGKKTRSGSGKTASSSSAAAGIEPASMAAQHNIASATLPPAISDRHRLGPRGDPGAALVVDAGAAVPLGGVGGAGLAADVRAGRIARRGAGALLAAAPLELDRAAGGRGLRRR